MKLHLLKKILPILLVFPTTMSRNCCLVLLILEAVLDSDVALSFFHGVISWPVVSVWF